MRRKLAEAGRGCKRQIAKVVMRASADTAPPDIGFMARLLIQATMPHSKPKSLVHTRSNGRLTLRMVGDPDFGLPYGVYPRLLLIHAASEVVRTGLGTIELGSSLAAFLTKLGLGRTGGKDGSITRLKEQADRLFHTVISWSYQGDGYRSVERGALVERHEVWWDPLRPDERDVFNARIQLHPKLVEEILAHPIPFEMNVIRALSKETGPLALDVYMWLVQRLFYLREPVDLTWEQLREQFGCDFRQLKNFMAAFRRALKPVLRLYPAARIVESPGGVTLWPSRPHVPPRPKRT